MAPARSSVLRSYTEGRWFAPQSGKPVYDAATGELVTKVSSDGIDFGAALACGRRTGGPALRELTFHQRAELAKAVGPLPRDHRDELYQLSYRTGATLSDSRFDIDGGIGVLLSYASKAKRELPNDRVLADGPTGPLGQAGQFLGQARLTPRRGVAVQVNAFNFPVWGPLEKLAPALNAGVPRLIKPASQTGYLTEQDLLSSTGSASTARRLRSHPNVVARSVRFNAEADSLNLSVPGPDAVPGTAAFDRYGQQLVAEMTVKAGQKCTAVRRAFVPQGALDAATEAVRPRARRGHRRQRNRRRIPVPVLIRAGGGRELGGLRMLQATTGRWVRGAPQLDDGTHPRPVTLEDIGHFAELTGDTFPRPGDYGEVRWDAEVTRQDGDGVAAYGVLTMVAKEWSE